MLEFDGLVTKVVNKGLLPMCIKNCNADPMVRVFCSNRVMMPNRSFCKEILVSCGLDDQSDVNICKMSRALSFRDCYWICHEDSEETWETTNLWQNRFSVEVGRAALTGNLRRVDLDRVYTGELTNKGTRSKCFRRDNGGIELVKHETMTEISAEIVVYYLTKAMGLGYSKYFYEVVDGLPCSVCRIETNENFGLLPCRDIMWFFNETGMGVNSKTYNYFLGCAAVDFVKMKIFDYITLNVDRNRDNYGLCCEGMGGLFPFI